MNADSDTSMAGLLKDTLLSTRNRRVYRYCNYDTRPDRVDVGYHAPQPPVRNNRNAHV